MSHEFNSSRTGSLITGQYHSSLKEPRRTSVVPVSRHSTRLNSVSRSLLNNSNESSSFSPSDKLRRMSTLFAIDRNKTKEAIMAALEDPARTEYRRLKAENEHLSGEWKRLRKFLEQLQVDYEASRPLDPLRRYKQLQAMIKRIVMHIRLTETSCASSSTPRNSELTLQGSVLQSETKTREMEKRIGQMCDGFTVEQLGVENRRLRDSNERLENRIQLIIQTVNELDQTYRSSKSDSVLRRYSHLRDAVKEIVTNEDLYENP